MKLKKIAIIALSPALIAACAPQPSSVVPTTIPSGIYAGMTCDQVRFEMDRVTAQHGTLIRNQRTAATLDAFAVLFTAMPLATMSGADSQGDLSISKGRLLALEAAARHCQAHGNHNINQNAHLRVRSKNW